MNFMFVLYICLLCASFPILEFAGGKDLGTCYSCHDVHDVNDCNGFTTCQHDEVG